MQHTAASVTAATAATIAAATVAWLALRSFHRSFERIPHFFSLCFVYLKIKNRVEKLSHEVHTRRYRRVLSVIQKKDLCLQ